MFRQSSSLSFRHLPALNKLSIHQPLPLSKRKSEQLLNLLTTSFRQHLDSEHPSSSATDNSFGTAGTERPRRLSLPDHESHHTDRHMHTILTNPLLNPSNITETTTHDRDPMDVFDRSVALGLMDTKRATLCLQAKKESLRGSNLHWSNDYLYDEMARSRAGMKALKWLVSSGISNDNRFLKNQAFAKILMEFIVMEELQEYAWKWIKRSFESLSTSTLSDLSNLSETSKREIGLPLLELVKAEAVRTYLPLDNAYMCLSRAASILNGAKVFALTLALQPAGRFLVSNSCNDVLHRPSPSVSTFESFLSLAPVVVPKQSVRVLAHLNVLHPIKPEATAALQYLHEIEGNGLNQRWTHPQNVIRLGLDTAKVLLQQNKSDDLEWTMDFLARNFPRQLAIDPKREYDHVKSEAANIEFLTTHLALT